MDEKELNFSKLSPIKYLFLFINFSLIGGILEFASFYKDGMFTFMQTGNLIMIVNNLLTELETFSFLYPLISLVSFIAFIFLFSFIKNIIIKRNKDYRIFSFICLIVISLIALFIPKNLDNAVTIDVFKIISVILNTFFGVVLVLSFTKFDEINFVPTMMTNNIKSFTYYLFLYESKDEEVNEKKHDKAKVIDYLIVIFSFIVGVVISFVLLYFLAPLLNIKFENIEFGVNVVYIIVLILVLVNFSLYLSVKKEKNNKLQ